MQEIFETVRDALRRQEDAVLVSVIAASGSVPRGRGAKMAVLAGTQCGTIGGGAVEHEAVEMAREALREGRSLRHRFSLRPGGVADIGMVCGGNVEVCVQYMPHGDAKNLALVEALLGVLQGGRDAWLLTRLSGDDVSAGLYDTAHGLRFLDEVEEAELQPLLKETPVLAGEKAQLYVEPIVYGGMVYIFGGGHVSQALLPVLAPLAFRATVFEDREAFVGEGILGSFDDIGAQVTITERDYVVIMTRGHAADTKVLAQALRTPARYIGMIGSRRKLASTLDGLRQQGFSDNDFARLHSPIGLPIGGRTPAEIAISIAAELILHRSTYQAQDA